MWVIEYQPDKNKLLYAGLPQKVHLQPRKPHLRVRKRPNLQLHEHRNQRQQTHHRPTPRISPLRRTRPRHPPTHRTPHPLRTLQHLPSRLLLLINRQTQLDRRKFDLTQAMYVIKCLIDAKVKNPLYCILSPQGICVSQVEGLLPNRSPSIF